MTALQLDRSSLIKLAYPLPDHNLEHVDETIYSMF